MATHLNEPPIEPKDNTFYEELFDLIDDHIELEPIDDEQGSGVMTYLTTDGRAKVAAKIKAYFNVAE